MTDIIPNSTDIKHFNCEFCASIFGVMLSDHDTSNCVNKNFYVKIHGVYVDIDDLDEFDEEDKEDEDKYCSMCEDWCICHKRLIPIRTGSKIKYPTYHNKIRKSGKNNKIKNTK